MNHFFEGWAGLMLPGWTELNLAGYDRVPLNFMALGGGSETRPEVDLVFPAPQSTYPVCAGIGLFTSDSGTDGPILYWEFSHWENTGKNASILLPVPEVTLLLDRTQVWQDGAAIGRTAAGGTVFVGQDVTLVDGRY
ncbi:MAG: hypothetical protein ABF876_13955 [Acetobacter aceti]|uniref:Uncharacterized protein n=1 Tax=Acetobacter aceti TaxID=435 RepID=A0A1U9KEX9_ACEAC|nr:hypothetical protein [Acetobacter aceti]AQS84355.1 hypothetical protein A0U92_05730 [Acetobacter aceti]